MKRTSRKSEIEYFSVDSKELVSHDDKDVTRNEMGIEWMLKPKNVSIRMQSKNIDLPEDGDVEEAMKPNPKELNPYLKDNGSGYPEERGEIKVGENQLLSSSVVGDGGASWRLKALKRAQEQAAREGQKLEEIVEERWGSLGHLAVFAAFYTAPVCAHLHAIKDRKRGLKESSEATLDAEANNNKGRWEYLKDASIQKSDMKEPKIHDSLSWRKKKGQNLSVEDTSLIAAAISSLNKFVDDRSFLLKANRRMGKYTEDDEYDFDGDPVKKWRHKTGGKPDQNFKKCLIMMFRKQEEVIFLETVIGLAKQRHHCLVACIPLPKEIARQALLPLMKLKKNGASTMQKKRLINTGEKGLRGSIPKNFPYFHFEFGLKEGFVDVINDESQFNNSLGLNVIRGMLQLLDEDMHRRIRYESIDRQKPAVATFAQQWEPLDWTKQLD
ncbi:hypothetical protein Scep_004838 [Stephania cephalantha]|uniref:Uncharacterized protein n=1 Tax=Stephania cephalantha TaxID=152367 RepID=A0AAP0KW32_9MAGN